MNYTKILHGTHDLKFNELELEIIEGEYWIHIVGWNGNADSSKAFTNINDNGRYIATSDCVFYYNFNSDATDACSTSGGGELTLTGMLTGSGGKMGNGLLPDGSGYAEGAIGGIDITNAWSFETWFKPTTTDEGVLLYIGDEGDEKGEDKLIIDLYTGDELHVEYDNGGFTGRYTSSAESLDFQANTWHHLAVTYDGSNDMDIFVNGQLEKEDATMTIASNVGGSTPSIYIGGHPDTPYDSSDFNGVMDDIRFVNYERHAFAGGLMISKVEPSTNTITLYNAGDTDYTLNCIELWTDSSRCGSEITSTTLASGATTTTTTCTIGSDDAVRLVDVDGDNDNSGDSGSNGNNKAWIIDGVCWNDDGSTIDSDCNAGDVMIDAGVWGQDSAIDGTSGGVVYFKLVSDGNNDEALTDWEAIPEFGTLLMPVASVLLIVGYNYRRKNTEA